MSIRVKLFLVCAADFPVLTSGQNVGGGVTSVIIAGSPRRNSVVTTAIGHLACIGSAIIGGRARNDRRFGLTFGDPGLTISETDLH
jgi:hypothetical protein